MRSDPAIVVKRTRPGNRLRSWWSQGRGPREERQQSTGRAQYRVTVSQALEHRTGFPEEYHETRRYIPEVGAVCPNWVGTGAVRGARGNSCRILLKSNFGVVRSVDDPNETLTTCFDRPFRIARDKNNSVLRVQSRCNALDQPLPLGGVAGRRWRRTKARRMGRYGCIASVSAAGTCRPAARTRTARRH